jgi:hypothetical protein
MKTFICFFIMFNLSAIPVFKKNVTPYSIIICKSDIIVDGHITKVLNGKYEFTIENIVKGKSNKRIYVKIWEDWTCDRRMKKPVIGQRLLLFLIKKSNADYIIINDSTGELFIDKDNSVTTFMNPNFPKIDVVKNGIKIFISSFEYYGPLELRYHENEYFKRLKTREQITKLEKQNKFFEKLNEEELKYFKVI